MKAAIKRLLQILSVILLAAIFLGLGLWQLDRAQELQAAKKIPVDTRIYPIGELASPEGAISGLSVGKFVKTTGRYLEIYKAPNQRDGRGEISDWEVGLLAQPNESAILVVRGLWSQRGQGAPIGQEVEITGSLAPRQFDNRAPIGDGQLARIDSSLLVATTSVQLFDGFIIATEELSNVQSANRTIITPPELVPSTGGYYWQHISYVVVWWFMVLLVLWAPLYRRREKKIEEMA